MSSRRKIFIGWDPHEIQAAVVAERSMRAHATIPLDIQRLALIHLRHQSIYTRPTDYRDQHLWDVLSEAPMSTEHAISRFFVPYLCEYRGWALFVDGDVLVRGDLAELFALADPAYAVQCVQHLQEIQGGVTKKDGAPQTAYPRKNWSSVMLFNCGHPANRALDLKILNSLPGRDLHRFCWLQDWQIGALPLAWNYLVNISAAHLDPDPSAIKLAHFTLGTPNLPAHAHDPFADEWWDVARRAGYHVPDDALIHREAAG